MSSQNLPPDTPEGYIFEQSIIYGKSKSHPGVFEIKFHNPKFKNAIGLEPEKKLTELIKQAENDNDIKVIVLHGGQYFSSGNDLSVFMKITDFDKMVEFANYGVNTVMVNLILALAFSKKPIIAVVRGGCVGIAFTILSHVSLVYCGPDAYFKAPFMESFQSPEGTSTLIFPQQFGQKKSNELLLCDQVLSAKDAVSSGFANQIIDKLNQKKEWFDLSLIPAIPKILSFDLYTILNMVEQINLSKDRKRIEEVTRREGVALVEKWKHPDFIPNMVQYMMNVKAKNKKNHEAKL